MTPRLVVTFGMVIGAVVCITAAAMARWRMVEEVGRKVPERVQVGVMRWYSVPNKVFKLLREHRRLYPRSRVRVLFGSLSMGALVFAITLAWFIGRPTWHL